MSNTPFSRQIRGYGSQMFQITSEPIGIQRSLAIQGLMPEFKDDWTSKWAFAWFHFAMISEIVNVIRSCSGIFAIDHSAFLPYYTADHTIFFESANDYVASMAFVLSSASCLTLWHIRSALKRNQREFLLEIQKFDEKEILFDSESDVNIFRKVYPVMKFACNSVNLTIISGLMMAAMFLPTLHTYRSLDYVLFIGIPWMPIHSMVIFVPSAIGIGLMNLFGAMCYQILLKIRNFQEKMTLSLEQDSGHPGNLASSYHNLRMFIFNQKKFWKQALGTPFLGWLFVACFCSYVVFFFPLHPIFKGMFVFWDFIAFTIFIPGIIAAHVNQKFSELRKSIGKLNLRVISIRDRFNVMNVIGDITQLSPMTCHDLFTFDQKILLRAFLELCAHLMLLVVNKR